MDELTITVWHQGSAITIYVSVAELLGLRDGQSLTGEQFGPTLRANATHGMQLAMKGIYERGEPDPSIRRHP